MEEMSGRAEPPAPAAVAAGDCKSLHMVASSGVTLGVETLFQQNFIHHSKLMLLWMLSALLCLSVLTSKFDWGL